MSTGGDNQGDGGGRDRKKSLPRGTIIGMPVKQLGARARVPGEPSPAPRPAVEVGPDEPMVRKPASPLKTTLGGAGLPAQKTLLGRVQAPPTAAATPPTPAEALAKADANLSSALSEALGSAPTALATAPLPRMRPTAEGTPGSGPMELDADDLVPEGEAAAVDSPPAVASAEPPPTKAPARRSPPNPIVRGLLVGMGLAALLVTGAGVGIYYARVAAAPITEMRGTGPAPVRAPRPRPVSAAPAAAQEASATAEPTATPAATAAPEATAPKDPAAAPGLEAQKGTDAPTAAAPAPAPAPAPTPTAAPAAPAAPTAAAAPAPAAAPTPAATPAPKPVAPAPAAPTAAPAAPTTVAELPNVPDAIQALPKDERETLAKKARARAMKELRGKNFDAALAAITESLTYDPGSSSSSRDHAEILLAAGKPEAAHPWAVRATTLAPRSADPYITLGDVEKALGRTEAAVAAWRRALQLKPDLAAAQARLAP